MDQWEGLHLGCLAVLKRAVDLTYDHRGDDLFHDRLFSYLQKQLPFSIDKIKPIKNKVYLVESEHLNFILKGFSSYDRLRLQENFTTALRQSGFENTYSFYPLTKFPLFFEHTYYGCLQYIEPSEKEFSYKLNKDRLDGTHLLNQFHLSTKWLTNRFQMLIPTFWQIEKWQERFAIFFNNLPIVKYFIQEKMLAEIIVWADWSLKGMISESQLFMNDEKVILHGDVAHHNFLRAKNNKLFLIDFDLISIGIPHIDYLQYANRILPHLNWSFEKLFHYEKLKPFLNEKGYIYALAFPTDIFREWNRAIKEGTYLQHEKLEQLLEMTEGQFAERQEFFKQLVYANE